MVMATGIVGIDAHLMGVSPVAAALFRLNIFVYGVLCTLTVLRIVRYPRLVLADLTDHLRGPAFFTLVAGSAVLGMQFVLMEADYRAAMTLWIAGIVFWVVLTYWIFAALTIKETKPTLDRGINGGWLLAVVATQSIAVLSAVIATHLGQPYRAHVNFLALSMWLFGGMLYIWMMSLIFYRYTFFTLAPADLAPPYWINMGAMAISTLAGSLLIINAPDAPFLLSLLPFLKGFTVLYWATGTWWIPMLVVLALWRYVYRRFPLRYDVLYWGAVFPLGMYAAASHEMTVAIGFDFLGAVPSLFFYLALVAWSTAFLGLTIELLRRVNRARD
jgi:tellurite resistance protein TehA-like permease